MKLYELFNERLNSEDYSELSGYNIRFAIVMVTNEGKEGVILPAFKTLPYKVKLYNAKDRVIKRYDVEVQIDTSYWNECEHENEESKYAIIDGVLNQLIIVYKKDMPVMNDDGTVKLKLFKPDLVFEGFSKIADKYTSNSAEMKKLSELRHELNISN